MADIIQMHRTHTMVGLAVVVQLVSTVDPLVAAVAGMVVTLLLLLALVVMTQLH
jgi:hypothetical protein